MRRADVLLKKKTGCEVQKDIVFQYFVCTVSLNSFDISAQTCRFMYFKWTTNISDIIINIS